MNGPVGNRLSEINRLYMVQFYQSLEQNAEVSEAIVQGVGLFAPRVFIGFLIIPKPETQRRSKPSKAQELNKSAQVEHKGAMETGQGWRGHGKGYLWH